MSFPSTSSSNVENFPPQVIRKVSKEVIALADDSPEGIKVFLNEDDITDIRATIEGPAGTPYEGGTFRMKLVLSKDFPASPPQGFFLTKIFHPNVASNGAICVNTLKRDWKPEHGIKHILITVKCLLIYPNPESALNEEAGKLLLEQYEDYSSRARMMTDIHAKPLRSSASASAAVLNRMEGPESQTSSAKDPCSEGVGSHTGTNSKKRPTDKSVVETKKKEKKKALKRL